MIKWIKAFFKGKDPYHDYLAKSTDLVDLENRQKELQRKGMYWL